MTVDYDKLTTLFPEFASPTTYPPATVTAWLDIAAEQLSPAKLRFGSRYDMALMLYAAHYLTLGARNVQLGAGGGISGSVSGPTQSKSVGAVSVSYNVNLTTFKNAGQWNQTQYGVQLYQMMRMLTAGGMYIPSSGRYSPPGPRRLT